MRLGCFFDVECVSVELFVTRTLLPALLLRTTTALVAMIAPTRRMLLMPPSWVVHLVARKHAEFLQVNAAVARIEQLELHLVEPEVRIGLHDHALGRFALE